MGADTHPGRHFDDLRSPLCLDICSMNNQKVSDSKTEVINGWWGGGGKRKSGKRGGWGKGV